MALALAGSAVAVADAQQDSRPGAAGLSADLLTALQRDLGLSAAQATARGQQQVKADQLDDVLRDRLGDAFGGAFFDAKVGKLVVGVTDAGRAAQVVAAGAQPRVVKHSQVKLDGIKGELDALAGAQGDNAKRTTNAKADTAQVAGLASWSVDPTTNQVVVTALKGKSAPVLGRLAGYGDAVRVQYTDTAPSTATFLDGGDDLNFPAGGCSAGFNMRNVNTGVRYMLTAGHCGAAGSMVSGQGGANIGPVLAAFFPTWDDALIRVDNTAAWTQGAWVDTNPSNGGVVVVSNAWSDAPVGTAICKSGRTTKLTCGAITAKRETVTYSGGRTVNNLTRHNACVEPGDSGGSNYRSGVNTPEGVTSGAQLYVVNGVYRCGAAAGQPNVSWYYPAAISVPYYQSVYGATLW